ncbi:MAG: ATP synthase F1 subunit delta [Alphaproteobacteria bacterium]|nr:ATP synthase F1 subunit delta [Alphaproteobacteria bacterium]
MSIEFFGNSVIDRYVKALYEVSVGRESEFVQQVKAVREAIESLNNREGILRRFSLLVKDGEDFVDTLVSELELLPEIGNFLKLVLSNKRFSIILDICVAFEKFCDRMNDKKVFYVTYAKDFSEKSRIQLAQYLQEMIGGTIEFVARQDKSLIDGLQIRYGSKILDYSVKSKLDRLKKSMRGEN